MAASRLLPANLSPWARAMESELAAIADDRAALTFAAGCLRGVVGLAVAARLGSAATAFRRLLFPPASSIRSLPSMNDIIARPRLLGLLCGAGAVGVGLAYMLAAGAPSRYLLLNFAALTLGAAAWFALGRTAVSRLAAIGPLILLLAVPLLATAAFGASVEGAARWARLGPVSVQPSLILLPAMLLLYARRPDPVGTVGMAVAALALALQPDRAMAGVLLAGLLALLAAAPGRLVAMAAAASGLAFGRTLVVPDNLPAAPHVDGILYAAFDVHPMAGAAVLIGAAALMLPAAAGASRAAGERPVLLVFGACWLAVVAAAALGNYPTPLVGFGGSAVLGYLLSVGLLPKDALNGHAGTATGARAISADDGDQMASELRVPQPA